jgi:hypothetical protein
LATRSYFWLSISLHSSDDWDTVKDFWSANELYYTPFYSTVICHQFQHVLRFFYFENTENFADGTSPNCDSLRNLGTVFNHFTCIFYSIPPSRKFGGR